MAQKAFNYKAQAQKVKSLLECRKFRPLDRTGNSLKAYSARHLSFKKSQRWYLFYLAQVKLPN